MSCCCPVCQRSTPFKIGSELKHGMSDFEDKTWKYGKVIMQESDNPDIL